MVSMAQTVAPATPSAVYRIAGTVVNAITGEPVRRAAVAVLSEEDDRTIAAVSTDNEGRFVLDRLPAAKYPLTASKRGYRTAFFDEHDGYNSAIVTGADQDTEHIVFRLTLGAVLHGTVTADGGDPVEGAQVMLFLKPHVTRLGERITQIDSTQTDDTGAYEFSNLAAGEYLLAVKAEPWYALHGASAQKPENDPSAALDVAYPVAYFDSTMDESAATPIILSGGSREQANIALHAVPALYISVQSSNKSLENGALALRQSIFGTQVSADTNIALDATGSQTAEFTGVAPGRYELMEGQPAHTIDFDANASQQIDPETGTLTVNISGVLRNSSGAALPERILLTLESADSSHPRESIRAVSSKGQFKFESVTPGVWELSAETDGPTGAELPVLSAMIDGKAHEGNQITVWDHPLSLVVIVAQTETRIQGFALKEKKGFAGAMVVLVPKNPDANRGLFRRDQADSDGSFSLRNVAPGSYTVVAIEDGWDLDWARPEVIRRYLPQGIAVTVTEASGKRISLPDPVPVQAR
jgi:5-hydroxyisourate hydrolase-like protein (transthyretin family)